MVVLSALFALAAAPCYYDQQWEPSNRISLRMIICSVAEPEMEFQMVKVRD